MNKKERSHIVRLYDLIDKVPFAAGGAATSTIVGYVAYSEDMKQFIPALKTTFLGILALDNKDDELIEGEDYHHPDKMLNAIEKWIKERESRGWEGKPPAIMNYYE